MGTLSKRPLSDFGIDLRQRMQGPPVPRVRAKPAVPPPPPKRRWQVIAFAFGASAAATLALVTLVARLAVRR